MLLTTAVANIPRLVFCPLVLFMSWS